MEKIKEMEETFTPFGHSTLSEEEALSLSIQRSQDYLLSRQYDEGYWVDELESNATITAELIFFMHLQIGWTSTGNKR